MKNRSSVLRKPVLIIIGCFLLSSCGDFLSTQPSDQYSEKTFWKANEQAQAGLVGVYNVLSGTYQRRNILVSDLLTPNMASRSLNQAWTRIAIGQALSTNDEFASSWASNYKGIGRANTVIANVHGVDADAKAKNEIKAEAKFLRAYFYSDLVNKFGGVPLILKAPDLRSQSDLPRTEKGKVVAQILKDLDEAAAVLPKENDPGHATKGAALALKARVLLYQSRWSEAAKAAKKVMDLGEYSLFPDYRGLFRLENEDNSSVIWDIQIKLPNSSTDFDSWASNLSYLGVLKELVDAYYMKDGKPADKSPLYDPSHPYQNRDPRLYQTVRLIGSMYNGEVTTAENMTNETGFGPRKWTTYHRNSHIPRISVNGSEINPIVIRYAEVLLTYAEAENEAVGPNASVFAALNKIRTRAGMTKVQSGLTQDSLKQVIRHERRIELALEGKYYTDIRRWGIAEKVMNGPVHDWEGNIYRTRSFEPKDTLWAIPPNQIDFDPNLKQNPGW